VDLLVVLQQHAMQQVADIALLEVVAERVQPGQAQHAAGEELIGATAQRVVRLRAPARSGTRSGATGAGIPAGCAKVSCRAGVALASIGMPARAQHADNRSIQPET
jgi:hypothetical protein